MGRGRSTEADARRELFRDYWGGGLGALAIAIEPFYNASECRRGAGEWRPAVG